MMGKSMSESTTAIFQTLHNNEWKDSSPILLLTNEEKELNILFKNKRWPAEEL